MESRKFSRRDFLRVSALAVAGAALPSTGLAKAYPVAQGTETIEMWMWETEPRWKNVEATSGLNEKFPDVEFKWTALPFDQLHEKALVALAAGIPEGLPDIIRTHPNHLIKLTRTGNLTEVTDVVSPYESDVLPSMWEQVVYTDGKIYSVPDDTGVMLFGYRWDIFEEAGLPTEPELVADLLATYDDLIEVAKTIEEATGAKGFNMPPTSGWEQADWWFRNISLQDTTGEFDKEGNVIFDDETHINAAEIVKRIWDAGITTDLTGPAVWQAYENKEIAMMRYPNWQDFVIIDAAPDLAGKWRATRLPAAMEGGKRVSSEDGVVLVVPSLIPDEKKALAIQVAEYMKLTVEATVAHMKEFSGAFVTYVPGLEAMVDEPSPMLDGQYTYQLFLDVAREEGVLPWYRSSAFVVDAHERIGDAIFRILTEGAPIAETLKEAADMIRTLQQEKGEM